MEKSDLRTEFSKETKTRFNIEWITFNDYVDWLEQRLVKSLTIPPVSGSYDSQKCDKCQGRTALVTGTFYYDADSEPYNNGVVEDAKVESGDCWVGGFVCDNCGNIQGLWHE